MTDAAPTMTQRSDHQSKSKGRKTKRRARVLLPQAEGLVEMHPRLFDRQVDTAAGTVVPQTTWIGISSQTGAQSPIFFIFPNGSLGVPYDQLSWRYSLQYAAAEVPRMLKRCNLNVRMRIKVRKVVIFEKKKKERFFWCILNVLVPKWPGYKVFYYEFRIYDMRVGQKVPITISRLVERVARGIHHLFLVSPLEIPISSRTSHSYIRYLFLFFRMPSLICTKLTNAGS
jgi:hypothetical protein